MLAYGTLDRQVIGPTLRGKDRNTEGFPAYPAVITRENLDNLQYTINERFRKANLPETIEVVNCEPPHYAFVHRLNRLDKLTEEQAIEEERIISESCAAWAKEIGIGT